MSLYQLQKFLYVLNRDEAAQKKYHSDIDSFISEFDLTDEEATALREGDIGLLYVLGVNGQILMHYAALLGIEWFDYLDMMRAATVLQKRKRIDEPGIRWCTESCARNHRTCGPL